jgi:Serine/Threonine/Tyrosine Kinase found in polyvalent proteins
LAEFKDDFVIGKFVFNRKISRLYSPTTTSDRMFMPANGFVNIRNYDYYNSNLGIILEDLHDENVLTQDGILYFIDTVFYVTNEQTNPAKTLLNY